MPTPPALAAPAAPRRVAHGAGPAPRAVVCAEFARSLGQVLALPWRAGVYALHHHELVRAARLGQDGVG